MVEKDRTTIDAIPVTSLYRTLLDQAATLSPQRLRSTLEAAQRRDLLDDRSLAAFLARSNGHWGYGPLSHAIRQLTDEAPWTQSELERRFLELIRAAGLPEPQCNVVVAGVVVDFYWPRQRLVVEIDGYRFHKTRRSFEDDRRKDVKLQLAGCRPVRITYQRIRYEPRALIADLARLLGSSPAP
jgi:very-short-patch-repair endonuclease